MRPFSTCAVSSYDVCFLCPSGEKRNTISQTQKPDPSEREPGWLHYATGCDWFGFSLVWPHNISIAHLCFLLRVSLEITIRFDLRLCGTWIMLPAKTKAAPQAENLCDACCLPTYTSAFVQLGEHSIKLWAQFGCAWWGSPMTAVIYLGSEKNNNQKKTFVHSERSPISPFSWIVISSWIPQGPH